MSEDLDNAKALQALGDGEPLVGWEAVDQMPEVAGWLRDLTAVRGELQAWLDDDGLRVNVYTSRYAHHLTFIPKGPRREEGYVGVTHRMRAGVEHTRTADGPDGDWSEKTWHHVVVGMLRMETVPLAQSATSGNPNQRSARRRRMKRKVKQWRAQNPK